MFIVSNNQNIVDHLHRNVYYIKDYTNQVFTGYLNILVLQLIQQTFCARIINIYIYFFIIIGSIKYIT